MRVILGDRYTIIRTIGKGGTSKVYLAKHNKLDCFRAIKAIPKVKENLHNYYIESTILKNINIKGIPIIYDVDEDEDNWYIIEEYIEGISLGEYIGHKDRSRKDLIEVIQGLCDILTSLHNYLEETVIYNDLKMENVIVSEKGIYIVDFGNCYVVGKEYEGCKNAYASKAGVTPEYLSDLDVGRYTDVYGIGIIIQDIYQKHKELFIDDKELIEEIIEGCLERKKNNRIQEISVIRKYIDNIIDNKNDKGMLKSANIFVFSGNGDKGVTHFSLGLTKYLKMIGKNSIYVEFINNNSITQYLEDYGFGDGTYKYCGCELMTYYDEFVSFEKNAMINIFDCSGFSDDSQLESFLLKYRKESGVDFDNVVVVVIGNIKKYMTCTDDYGVDNKGSNLIETNSLFEKNNIIYVANFSDDEGIKKYCRNTGKYLLKMPLFEDPFVIGRDEKKFYEKVYGQIKKMCK